MSDLYRDLDSLKRDRKRGRDYRIRVVKRKSILTVIAPHGGFIDAGTSALARAVAADEYSLFDFQGLVEEPAHDLHVTSHRFRDDQLTGLLHQSFFAVSIHGMGDHPPKPHQIWLGGLNFNLKQIVKEALEREGFDVNAEPPKFKGEHPSNVVNLTPLRGVQIELPLTLRKTMFQGKLFHKNGRCPKQTAVFARFVRALRNAIAAYESGFRMPETIASGIAS
jgi:phage replication-related protein YjqB (UPF0714/DUF867 family)